MKYSFNSHPNIPIDVLARVSPDLRRLLLFGLPFSVFILCWWGGPNVLLVSTLSLTVIVPIVSYFSRVYRIRNLLNAYLLAVSIKMLFLILRIGLANADYHSEILSIGDAEGYFEYAFMDSLPLLSLANTGYPLFLRFMVNSLALTQETAPITLILPSIFAGSLLPVFVCIAVKEYISSSVAILTYWMAVFDAFIALYSTVLLKDVLVGALVGFSFVVFCRARYVSDYILNLLMFVSSAFFSFLLRYKTLSVAVCVVLSRILFSRKTSSWKKYNVGAICVMFVTVTLLANVNPITMIIRGKGLLEYAEHKEERAERKAKSGRLITLINKSDSFIVKASCRSAVALLAPLPPVDVYKTNLEGIHNQARLAKNLAGIYWHWILPFVILGAWHSFRDKNYFPLVTFSMLIFMMGLTMTPHPRFRLMVTVPAYMLVARALLVHGFKSKYAFAYYSAITAALPIYEAIM